MKEISKRRLVYFLPVPVIVTAVAVAQIYFATFGMLASSEGGGFGMFSTIDSPEARLIDIRAIDSEGAEISIEYNYQGSPVSENLIKKIKSNPERRLLTDFADYLLKARYVSTHDRKESLRQKIESESPGFEWDAGEKVTDSKLYRFATNDDKKELGDSIVRLNEVTLQMWSLTYDQNTRRVSTEKLGAPVVLRE
jgi:hypothetical protein